MRTFYHFIQQFKDEDTALGDLTRHIINDKTFPRKAVKHKIVYNYLIHVRDCYEGYENNEGICSTILELYESAYSKEVFLEALKKLEGCDKK